MNFNYFCYVPIFTTLLTILFKINEKYGGSIESYVTVLNRKRKVKGSNMTYPMWDVVDKEL